MIKLDHDLGTITPGKLADLILVGGDPTRNISDIRKVVLVVKDGTMYDPAKLYATIGGEAESGRGRSLEACRASRSPLRGCGILAPFKESASMHNEWTRRLLTRELSAFSRELDLLPGRGPDLGHRPRHRQLGGHFDPARLREPPALRGCRPGEHRLRARPRPRIQRPQRSVRPLLQEASPNENGGSGPHRPWPASPARALAIEYPDVLGSAQCPRASSSVNSPAISRFIWGRRVTLRRI